MTLESMQVGSEGVSLQAQEPDMTTQTVPVPDSPSVLTIESPRAESPSHSEKRAPSSTNSPTAQAVVGTSSNWWAPHPENPRNWEKGRKWRSTIIMSLYTLVWLVLPKTLHFSCADICLPRQPSCINDDRSSYP